MMKHFEEFDKLIKDVADYKKWNFERDGRFYLLVSESSSDISKESRVFLYNISEKDAVAFVVEEGYNGSRFIIIPESFNNHKIVGVYVHSISEHRDLQIPKTVECILGAEHLNDCPMVITLGKLPRTVIDDFLRHSANQSFMHRLSDSIYSADEEDLLYATIDRDSNVTEVLQGVKVIHHLNVNNSHIDLVIPESVEKIIKIDGCCRSLSFEGAIPEMAPGALEKLSRESDTVCVMSPKKESGVVKMNNLYDQLNCNDHKLWTKDIVYAPTPHTVDKAKSSGYITLTSELDGKTILVNSKYVGAIVPCTYACAVAGENGKPENGYVEGSKILVVMMTDRNEVGTWLDVYESIAEVDAKLAVAKEL